MNFAFDYNLRTFFTQTLWYPRAQIRGCGSSKFKMRSFFREQAFTALFTKILLLKIKPVYGNL